MTEGDPFHCDLGAGVIGNPVCLARINEDQLPMSGS
jgi:hypothetical protein